MSRLGAGWLDAPPAPTKDRERSLLGNTMQAECLIVPAQWFWHPFIPIMPRLNPLFYQLEGGVIMPDFKNLAIVMHSVLLSPSPGCKPSGMGPYPTLTVAPHFGSSCTASYSFYLLFGDCNAKDEREASMQDPRNGFRPAHEMLDEYLPPRPNRRGLAEWSCRLFQNEGSSALVSIKIQNPALTGGAC